MQLGDILDDLSLDVATSAIEITSVDVDSRLCEDGSLFFALPGASSHGITHAPQAVANGALAVVSDREARLAVPLVVVPATQLHALMAHASATIVEHPERDAKLVGVTGTNGKTSVTTILASLARSLGWNGGNVGTLTNARTTPSSPELFRTLRGLVSNFDPTRSKGLVALEVSSHALDQGRVEGLHFCVAAFTNLSHDHLDYHHTMEEYFAAKAALFTKEFANRAVIWRDDVYGQRLATETALPVTTVSRDEARDVVISLRGSTFFWRGHLVNSPLVGGYNVDNALLAMTIMSTLGVEDREVAGAMGEVTAVPGRFDVLYGRDVAVVIDYAHTPDGLARLLEDVRTLAPNARILTVFGAGGDRDRAKRPAMGQVVSARSDVTFVTSDNPRSEVPNDIINAVFAGADESRDVRRESDRALAIAEALELAGPGDVVVIAGKGHETTQIIGEDVLPFDDHVVARELLT